jgi:hypothetical protein
MDFLPVFVELFGSQVFAPLCEESEARYWLLWGRHLLKWVCDCRGNRSTYKRAVMTMVLTRRRWASKGLNAMYGKYQSREIESLNGFKSGGPKPNGGINRVALPSQLFVGSCSLKHLRKCDLQ